MNLLTWKDGPAFLGRDVWGGNVCYKCSEAGLEIMPVIAADVVVFALMRGEEFIAGLKMDRMAADEDFVEEITELAETLLKGLQG